MTARGFTAEKPSPWREVFVGSRGRMTIGLLILEALIAIEIMVVAAILPQVERELEGLQLYGWIYTSLTLASFGAVPIAGRMTDRVGPSPVLGVSIGFYVVGLLLAATAPTMFVLVVARFVQGIGGGGLYVVSLASVAKTYPERIRPRVMALLASMWILPGLLGPSFGAIITETVGWRWAFVAPLPLILLAVVLVMPSMRVVEVGGDESRLPVVASLALMVGAGLFLGGLTWFSVWAIPIVALGLAVTIPALRRITPAGTLVARRGLAAAAASAFLASAAFFAIDGFVTLMLTEIRGLSLGAAGVVLTLSALAWAFGSWWQSRTVQRRGARQLTAFGGVLVAVGGTVVALGLLEVPLAVPYIGWTIGSVGMGIVFPTVPLSVMGEAREGREAGELSSMILMDYLGVGVGAGLAGVCVALADAGTLTLEQGVAGAFGVGIVAAIVLALIAGRLPDARPAPESVAPRVEDRQIRS
ncbi:MAG TPA: MFS transporter [Actinomycetota bacterium]|nr:MFS transporter [Actinomycetota bacterium]